MTTIRQLPKLAKYLDNLEWDETPQVIGQILVTQKSPTGKTRQVVGQILVTQKSPTGKTRQAVG